MNLCGNALAPRVHVWVVMDLEDSTGKYKISEAKTRHRALLTIFAVGFCIGMLMSEVQFMVNVRRGLKRQLLVAHSQDGVTPAASKIDNRAAARTDDPLEKTLMLVAPDMEVMVAVSNKNPLFEGMLDTFLSGVKQAQISNYLVVALDKETESAMLEKNVNVFYWDLKITEAQRKTGENHAVSALKFRILKRFLKLGWNVFLSDVDVCVLSNPFKELFRDSDIEGMSDGFDDRTAYGSIEYFDDPSMGWARSAQYYKRFNLNSGLFYVKANERTIDLMQRLEDRLDKEDAWDQSAFNEAVFFLSHDDYKSPQVSVRVLNIYKFMNSKVLFKDVRKRSKSPGNPVTVHINYHPDKHERMKAVFKYYLDGDKKALDPFPGGSEKGT